MSIGFHVSKAHIDPSGKKRNRTMPVALREDMETLRGFGFNTPCAQIFVSGPQSFKETLTDEEKLAVRRFVIENRMQLVVHGSYLDNPWTLSPGSVHNIKQEMRIAAQIGATGVIVHLGKGASDDANLKYVLEEVSNLPEDVRHSVILWLEIHTAKPSTNTYETSAKLRRLFERVALCDTKGMRVGLCIDTAHLFSCGMALRDFNTAKNWLDGLPSVPVMLHLNDSASTLGSGIDAHEVLTRGHIWEDFNKETGRLPIETSGLMAILTWAEENKVVTILERDQDGTLADLMLIRDLGFFQ